MGDKKSIAVCSTSFYEFDRRLQRIIGTLVEMGHKVYWISRTNTIERKPLDNVQHIYIKTRFKSGPLFYLEFNLKLKSTLKRISCDLINAVDLDTLLGSYLALKKNQNQLIFDAHEIFYEVPELTNKPLKKLIWKKLANFVIPKVKAAYTVNNSLKNHYELHYKKEFRVIRNVPLSEKSITAETKTNNKILVYLGVLNKGRGLELAIEAVHQLIDYELILIGEGDLSEKLRKLAAGNPRIKFKGYIKPNEISKILETSSIGLNMLTAESENYRLSLANKYFDYMHAGLPSINMDYPEYNYLISEDKTGLLVSQYNLENLIKAIKTLEQPDIYSELHTNSLQACQKYTWQEEKKKLASIYSGL